MRKQDILKGLIIITGVTLSIAACNKDDDEPVLDFNITVPESWTEYKVNTGNVVYYAVSPLENTDDSISEDVLITKDDIQGSNLSQFCTAVIDSYDNDTSFHQLYFSPEDSTMNGAECRKLIHLQTIYILDQMSYDSVPLNAKMIKYMFVRNRYGYVVGLNSMVESYPDYKPVFEEIISSFSFKN